VIRTIKAKGIWAKIDRFSVYFLHRVQEHMRHHGDEYYQEAKSAVRCAAAARGLQCRCSRSYYSARLMLSAAQWQVTLLVRASSD
jgi:hypothetical protein